MARQVRYNDLTIAVPDDATDDEVAAIIETKEQESRVKPFQPGPVERGGRYLAEWGQGIRDAATQPLAEGPTGLPLVDAAAGVADFGASAVSDTLTAVPRLARMAFTGARGGKMDPEWLTRQPITPVGKALQDTAGAVMRPVGDALTATGLPPDVVAFGTELVGTAADVIGLHGAGRGARAAVRGARPDLPNPTPGRPEGLRPFGKSVEKARTLGFRVLPSQVAGRAQAEAPMGRFGFNHKVPYTFVEGFTATDLVPQTIIDNQKRVNSFVAKDLGISEITPQGLALAKNPHSAVYNEVARSRPYIVRDEGLRAAGEALGAARRNNPYLQNTTAVDEVRARLFDTEAATTQQVIDAIREFRKDANTAFKKVGDVEAEQAAFAYRAAADALEDALERQVGMVDPTIIPRFRDARTALAKIHNVEDALDGANVDPQKLVRISEKYPLSGYLADIAEVARDFPDTMRSATGVGLPAQSQIGSIWSPHLFARRALGREQGPRILRDAAQAKFGAENPLYDPRPAPRGPDRPAFADYQPPGPEGLPPAGGTMPPAPVLGREFDQLTATGLADDFDTLPPATARPGDLTAETPPMGGSLPAGLTDDLAAALTDLGLEPPLPPRGPDTLDFAPDPDLASLLVGDDPLGQRVPQAPGGDALDINRAVTPPLTDTELLDLQLQTALPPGPDPRLGDVRGRPLPPDDDLAAGLVPAEPPGPRGGGDVVDLDSFRTEKRRWDEIGRALDRDTRESISADLADLQAAIQQGKLLPADLLGRLRVIRNMPDAEEASFALNRLLDEIDAANRVGPSEPQRALTDILSSEPTPRGDELTIEPTPERAGPRELELAPPMPEPDDIRARYRGDREIPPGAIIYESPERAGYIAARPMDDGSWQIRTAFVKEGSRKQGIGQKNLIGLVKMAESEKTPLHSDKSLSRDQVERVYKRLQEKGVIEFDGDVDAVLRAMDDTDNAVNPSGEPWIKNLRLGTGE